MATTALTVLDGPSYQRAADCNAIMRPAGISCKRFTLIDAGGMDDVSQSPARNPETATVTNLNILRVNGRGTILRAMMAYVGTPTTDPIIKLFGRFTDAEAWRVLPNKNGDASVTLTSDPTNDATDGTLVYTLPDPVTHSWDLDGANEVIALVQTALAGGTTASALLTAWMI